jgi:CRISPR/Cas system CSM-associated protein Csm4 (group 5 of RAMP superfamily)
MLEIANLQNQIKSAIKYDLEDDPYAKLRFSAIAKQQLAEISNLPLQNRHKALTNLKRQIDERYLEEIPLVIANLPNKNTRERQQAYYGIMLLCLDDSLTINDKQQLNTEQLAIYAINIDEIIENNKINQMQYEYTKNQINIQLLALLTNNNFNSQLAKNIVTTIQLLLEKNHGDITKN